MVPLVNTVEASYLDSLVFRSSMKIILALQ